MCSDRKSSAMIEYNLSCLCLCDFADTHDLVGNFKNAGGDYLLPCRAETIFENDHGFKKKIH